jgi:hypothetical protein
VSGVEPARDVHRLDGGVVLVTGAGGRRRCGDGGVIGVVPPRDVYGLARGVVGAVRRLAAGGGVVMAP